MVSVFYILYMSFLGIFATLASLFGIRGKVKMFLYVMILWGLVPLFMWFYTHAPYGFFANEDLRYMYKVYEKTIISGRYPFEDLELTTNRPNYVYYPTSFMMQAALSIITGIDPKLLMYVSLSTLSAYIIIVLLIALMLKHAPTLLRPLVLAPLFGFLGITFTGNFIYSKIPMTLILLILYYAIYYPVKNFTKNTLILAILSVATVLGHSQQPITFLLLLVIFTLVQQALGILFKYRIDKSFIYFFILFTTIVIAYNIFRAGSFFEGIITFMLNFINTILSTRLTESIESKATIAYGILTPFEILSILLGYLLYLFYGTITISKYLVRSFKKRDINTISYGITLMIYTTFGAVLPLIAKEIGADLWWRPLWALEAFASIGSIMVKSERKSLPASNRPLSTFEDGRHLMLFVVLIAITSLFLFANLIYTRIHLSPSKVYLHETLIMNEFYAVTSNKGSIFNNMNTFRLIIIDTPSAPAYEILNALKYANISSSKIFTLFLNCNISTYYLDYFNGKAKPRDFSLLKGRLDACVDDIEDIYAYNSNEIIIIGGEQPSILLNISLVFTTKSFFIGLVK